METAIDLTAIGDHYAELMPTLLGTPEGAQALSHVFPDSVGTISERDIPNLIEAFQVSASTLSCEESLYEFQKEAWQVIEPETQFVDNWHIGCISEHLQECAVGTFQHLIINMPPRFAKSTNTTVGWPCWVWIHWPACRFLTASHSMDLSIRDTLRSRDIFTSMWFQLRWGHRFRFKADQNVKSRYANNHMGYRIAAAVGKKITGEGADIRIIDDPLDIKDAYSDTIRTKTNVWHDTVWTHRVTSQDSRSVMIGHRTHCRDLFGHCLAKDLVKVEHVKLSMRQLDPARRVTTVLGNYDPREEEGELLCEDRFDEEAVTQLEAELGTEASGLLDQEPVEQGGNLIQSQDFRYFELVDLLPDEAKLFEQIDDKRRHMMQKAIILNDGESAPRRFLLQDCTWFQTVDTALKEKEQNDRTAVGTFLITPEWDLIVWEVLAERLKVPRQYGFIKRQRARFPWLAFQAVEDKQSGTGIIQQGAEDGHPFDILKADKDKIRRAGPLCTLYVNHKVWHPMGQPHWLAFYETEVTEFPAADHDDRVDVAAYAALKMLERRLNAPRIRSLAEVMTAAEKRQFGVPLTDEEQAEVEQLENDTSQIGNWRIG
jgi:predicted phage terminase large subunit-like protein